MVLYHLLASHRLQEGLSHDMTQFYPNSGVLRFSRWSKEDYFVGPIIMLISLARHRGFGALQQPAGYRADRLTVAGERSTDLTDFLRYRVLLTNL